MNSKKISSSITDNTDICNLLLTTLDKNLVQHIPMDNILAPTHSNFIRSRASFINKYHNYFWKEDQYCENWNRVLSIFDDYRHLREKALSSSKLKSNDFDNLLSEDNLMFLHQILTNSFVDPINHIESGIDDFEITFRIPPLWQEQVIDELYCHSEIKEGDHYSNDGYRQRYGIVKEYRFKTGGIFVFHRKKSLSKGDCLISFRLSETPWRNIRIFFNCIYKALGSKNYNEFHSNAVVTRKDPYFLIKGIPLPLLLVDTTSTNKGQPIKRQVIEDIKGAIQGSSYWGNRHSSHTISYCMYAKLLDLQHKLLKGNKSKKVKKLFGKLFDELSSVHCIAKIERRIDTHQQGSKYGLIRDMNKLRWHTFNKLEFYSPLVFNELSPSIINKVFNFGLANVREELTCNQVEVFNRVISNPDHKLYFNSQPVVNAIEMQLTKLQHIIQSPLLLANTIKI